jgi:inner membrane protein
MSPGQHFIISWVTANTVKLDRKSRICITLSGLLPDVDGAGYIYDKIAKHYESNTEYYEQFHHIFGHNIFFGLSLALLCFFICRKSRAVFWLSFVAFNLHIICDIAGARGPDGDQWPISYLYPMLPDVQLVWSGQWELSSWINSTIGVFFFCVALYISRHRHVTFFEFFSKRFEKSVCQSARDRGFFKE